MEYKSIGQSLKDVDVKEGIVTGYFSAFGMVDSDGDIIQKGAFAKTISEGGPQGKNRIKHLMDHDHTKTVAKILSLREDDYGLYYESKAGRHTIGRDFLLMAEDGIITEHSIGFRIINRTAGEGETMILTELKLWEGSSLHAWGANGDTPITGVKSADHLLDLFAKLEKALKTGTYSDEAFLQIEAKYKQINEYFKTTQPETATVPSERKETAQTPQVSDMDIFKTFKQALLDGQSTK